MNVTSAKPEAFDYDPVGNRRSGPSVTDTGYVNNEANQMTTGRKLTYGYDNFGNQTTKTVPGASDKSWVQTWDLQNRLVKVEKVKGAERRTVTFKYDPFGRRIEKQMTTVIDGTTKTRTWNYIYDGSSIAVELSTENSTTTKTFYTHGVGVDEHLAMERGGQFYYYHADGLGSITSITDAGQHVVQSYEYDSYGMVKPLNGFENSYAYTGREWDKETGLYYYRARYYDPLEGKFIQKDPIGFVGGINVYAYVSGNPVNGVDPSGLVHYEVDSTGFHVRLRTRPDLTVGVSFNDTGNYTISYKGGHPVSNNDFESATKMFGELMNDPNERMKMKDAISTAFDKPEFKNKEFIREMGKNFRSACQKIGVKPNIKIKGAKTGVGGILGMLLQIPGILDAQKRADELGVDIWTIMLMDYGFFDVPGPT